MKRILSFILVAALALSVLAFVGCNKNNNGDETTGALKLGLGVYTTVSATDATADKNGAGEATMTVAAVLVDENGKIVKCFIDCADNSVAYTADGKAVANDSFATKYELGDAYNMVAYGQANREWYAQADAFCALVAGKTVSEVKALVASDYKGTDEVQNAGCTIYVSDFALAIEKAVASAVASNATAKDTIKVGVSTTQSTSDATADKNGSNEIETTFFAAAVNGEGKITAAKAECVQVDFTFDAKGASKFDATKPVAGKYEKGDAYNMVAYGQANREWYAQADAFCAATIGKTAGDVNALMASDNKGVDEVKNAGCTILVDGFVKAASKVK